MSALLAPTETLSPSRYDYEAAADWLERRFVEQSRHVAFSLPAGRYLEQDGDLDGQGALSRAMRVVSDLIADLRADLRAAAHGVALPDLQRDRLVKPTDEEKIRAYLLEQSLTVTAAAREAHEALPVEVRERLF